MTIELQKSEDSLEHNKLIEVLRKKFHLDNSTNTHNYKFKFKIKNFAKKEVHQTYSFRCSLFLK